MGDEKVVERNSAEILEAMKATHAQATVLMDRIIALFGGGVIPNRVAYSRGLAMERLEEVMFRVNEGTQWMLQNTPDIREKMAEQALKQATGSTPSLTVVDGGKS